MGIYNNWTFADFKKKIFYIHTDKEVSYGSIPVGLEHHKFFIENFLNNGVKTCSFKDMKAMIDKKNRFDLMFDGRKRRSFNYGSLPLSQWDFHKIFPYINKKDANCDDVITKIFEDMYKLEQEIEDLKKDEKDELKIALVSLKNLANYLKK